MKEKWRIFDCDNVLYDDRYINQQFARMFEGYISEYLEINPTKVKTLTEKLKQEYSTEFSIVAYARAFDMNFSDMVRNTYLRLDLSMIIPDQRKKNILKNLDGEKIVFTANPSAFAKYILDHIGLLENFSKVIGMEETGFIPKNDIRAYLMVEKLIQRSAEEEVYFCDDSAENLDIAKKIGWKTIWYNPKRKKNSNHVTIQDFEELLGL